MGERVGAIRAKASRHGLPRSLSSGALRGKGPDAETRDRTGDLQIFSLTLSQLSYRGLLMVVARSFAPGDTPPPTMACGQRRRLDLVVSSGATNFATQVGSSRNPPEIELG